VVVVEPAAAVADTAVVEAGAAAADVVEVAVVEAVGAGAVADADATFN